MIWVCTIQRFLSSYFPILNYVQEKIGLKDEILNILSFCRTSGMGCGRLAGSSTEREMASLER
jgi:hypothetical protein